VLRPNCPPCRYAPRAWSHALPSRSAASSSMKHLCRTGRSRQTLRRAPADRHRQDDLGPLDGLTDGPARGPVMPPRAGPGSRPRHAESPGPVTHGVRPGPHPVQVGTPLHRAKPRTWAQRPQFRRSAPRLLYSLATLASASWETSRRSQRLARRPGQNAAAATQHGVRALPSACLTSARGDLMG